MALTSTTITRLYNFLAGTRIKSSEVDAELDQLVASVNAIVGDLAKLDDPPGAALIGFEPPSDMSSTNVQSAITEILLIARDAQLGLIVDGTITRAKLEAALQTVIMSGKVHDVGGTATAITITDANLPALYDNMPINFIAGASNNAAATTLNAKPVYRANTTSAPNFISGKQYSVWYDLGADCFFLKASAEGSAVAANVLAGTTFSNDVDTLISGAMTDRAGDTVAIGSNISGTTLKLLASEGYRDGTNDYVTITDADFGAGNIKNGVNLFGMTGTLSTMTTSVSSGAVVGYYTATVSQTTSESAGSGIWRTPSAVTASTSTFSTSGAKNGIIMRSNPTTGSWAIGTNYGTNLAIVSTSYNWGGTGVYLVSSSTGEHVLISNMSGMVNEGSTDSYLLSLVAFFSDAGALNVFTTWGGVNGAYDRTDYTTKDVSSSFFSTSVYLKAVAGGDGGSLFPYAYSYTNGSTYSAKTGFYGTLHTF